MHMYVYMDAQDGCQESSLITLYSTDGSSVSQLKPQLTNMSSLASRLFQGFLVFVFLPLALWQATQHLCGFWGPNSDHYTYCLKL